MCERTTAECVKELSPTQQENKRQHQLLDAYYRKHHQVVLRTDTPEQQEWNASMEQDEPHAPRIKVEEEEPLSPHVNEEDEAPRPLKLKKNRLSHNSIKEEEKEHSISQEGEHVDVTKVPLTAVIEKREDDEVKGRSEEMRGVEPPSSSSTQHMTTDADGDHCGGSQANKLLAPLSDSDDTASHLPDSDDEDSEADKTCHTDNTHFKCSNCGKTFKYPSDLKIHMRIHTGEKPFMCSVCSRSFSRKEHLIKHTRIHTGEKPFICSECNKSFCGRTNLGVHMRTHTGDKPFACLVCSKRFSLKQHLTVHTRIHTGEKPFSCLVCGKGCIKNSDLKKHMRTHTGEKPYSCTSCNKCFGDQSALLRHIRKHTFEKV
ncbi:zinc finger protein 37-like [Nerophis ophidion]|uniref:zinc finger protein 37-like n=1 Tax=Nerophis ophidion TaxID=159077 RepID=UPI002ADFBC74|nr:zinc finger protein 37-like [Nerophis ophidion]